MIVTANQLMIYVVLNKNNLTHVDRGFPSPLNINMYSIKTRWGAGIFIFSFMLIAGSYVFIQRCPNERSLKLYTSVFPVLCSTFSVMSFFIGHFSYPRVQNLKVYLLGYLSGLTGISFVLYTLFIESPALYIRFLHLIIFLNYIIVLILPTYTKYRTTRSLTRGIVFIEVIIFSVIFFSSGLITWVRLFNFKSFYDFTAWGSIVWFGFVLLISLSFIKGNFHLGGVITGCTLFYLASWMSPLLSRIPDKMEQILFTCAPLYLVIGILIHWFARMEHRVCYDPLLQVYNRNECFRIIEEQSYTNTSPPFGVAMIDIDHFKKINDTHGHQVGDQVLFHVAQTVQREVVPEGIVCRYGGEEIAVFFPKKQSKRIFQVMERVRSEIEHMKINNGRKNISVTISCGIAHRSSSSQRIVDTVRAADKALYRAKSKGRNQVRTAGSIYSRAKRKGRLAGKKR